MTGKELRDPRARIMIVEDESITALGIRNSLEDMGYAVTCICESGEAALKTVQEEMPDLILMDVTLRGEMDGTESAGKIRSRLKIPVVYLTAHTDEETFQQAKITDPFGYLVKPFDDRELKIAIEIALYKDKMESALRESKMKYSALFKTAADAIYMIEAKTHKIVDCNSEAARITGYSTRELKTMTVFELYPTEEQDIVTAIFCKIDKLGALSGISGISQKGKDGRLVPVEINASTVRLGGKKYIIGIFRDITVRKNAEEALLYERNKLTGILDAIKDGIYITNQNYEIEYVNPSFKKEFKVVKGGKCFKYFHGRKQACPMCKHKEVFFGETVHWEWSSPKSLKSFDVIDVPLKNPDGSVAKLAILRDVTKRKKMEEQLKESSITDELTGLLNRRGFFTIAEQHVKLSLRSGREMFLIYLDLDYLKEINDKLGHRAGDKALIDFAGLLKRTYRESDVMARIGGDEFAVLLTDNLKAGGEQIIARHLYENLDSYNEKGGRPFSLSVSMGTICYDPKTPCSLDDLISRADVLMYNNKKHRKSASALRNPVTERREQKRIKTGDEFTAELDNSIRTIKDLSTGGICVETPDRPETGETRKIKVLKDNKEIISCTSGEVWNSEAAEGKYYTGWKFIDPGKKARSSLERALNE